MFDIKKLIICALVMLGVSALFSFLLELLPLWLWAILWGAFITGTLLWVAYEPREKLRPRYWLVSVEYTGDDGKPRRAIELKKGYGKLFFTEGEVAGMEKWLRFHVAEISEETAELIAKKIEQLNLSKQEEDGLEQTEG